MGAFPHHKDAVKKMSPVLLSVPYRAPGSRASDRVQPRQRQPAPALSRGQGVNGLGSGGPISPSAPATRTRTSPLASRSASVRAGTAAAAAGPISPSAAAAPARTPPSSSRSASIRAGTADGPISPSAARARVARGPPAGYPYPLHEEARERGRLSRRAPEIRPDPRARRRPTCSATNDIRYGEKVRVSDA